MLEPLRKVDNATALEGTGQQGPSGLLPFRLISSISLCGDVILILGISELTGIVYHLAMFSTIGSVEAFFGVGALTAANFSAVLAARGAYLPQKLVDLPRQLSETATVWLLTFLLLSLVAFSLKVGDAYSRIGTYTFFAAGWVCIAVYRFILSRFIARAMTQGGFAEQRVILLAEEGQLDGSRAVESLRRCGYRPARTFEFAFRTLSSPTASSALFKSIQEQLVEMSRSDSIQCVFLLVSWDNRAAIERLMEFLRTLAVPVYLLPDRHVAHFLQNKIVNVASAWTAELKRAPLTNSEQAFKRTLDLLIACAVLVLLAPMLALIGILIKIESRGPVLFMQTRNGFNGRPFKVCKFRTMFVVEDGPVIRQATKNDPRVTHFGRLLRRSNIDELPQLLNVIAGDMSLVGPRPHAVAHNSEYEKIIANYAYRYHVKPGLTGWAQVNGLRGETQTVELMTRRVEYDLWYIENWSVWLDFKIMLRTLVLGLQPNAY